MPKTKKEAPAPEKPGVSVNNCHFEANSAANKHTRAAVVALAEAATANAKAIEAAALALTRAGGETIGLKISN